ncbi:hypothetical protein [Streptomyces brasiliensis]|uniref:Uncharacterized protein n=1 Tax=Streptomyces brasiliensis TaxID=1954 RepID=A0A917NZY2_9ACTN|nr:hypothetical protein [Streptomyces brasiliensis]GGJ45154.1 hypothetical protein GCM10010121_065500 [Streptomyces brasiliensis]
MRFRIGAAVIAATMFPLFAAPAADAATAPKITWGFGKGAKVDAKSKVTINYSLAGLPKNSHVELRREMGTARVFKKVVSLKAVNGKGSVTTTAPAQGRWSYRIYVLDSKNKSLGFTGHYLYAYSNISIRKFFPYNWSGGSVTVGGRLLQYEVGADYKAWDVFATTKRVTCRSVSLKFGRLKDYGSMDSSKRKVMVVQADADPVSTTVPYDAYVTLNAKLTGAAFGLHLNQDPQNTYSSVTYVGGTANCYTASGF